MSDLPDVFLDEKDDEDEDDGDDAGSGVVEQQNGRGPPVELTSTAFSGGSTSGLSSSEDVSMKMRVSFLGPPPPKGEPIQASSLPDSSAKSSNGSAPSGFYTNNHQRHSLPSNLGAARNVSPSHYQNHQHHVSPVPKRESLASTLDEESFVDSFQTSLRIPPDSSSHRMVPKPSFRASRATTMEGGSAMLDFSQIPRPSVQRAGERTVSTTLRLRRQGFKLSQSGRLNFAVKSIRRGSDEWNGLIKPFVADLAFRSLVYPRFQSEVSFRPYTCQAAVLFVDLSNYSGITAAIAHKGPHALSGVVNAYLGRILEIVRSAGGDAVKFAGDAVLVVWEGQQDDLEMNCYAAAKCALELQERAGVHEIEGTSLSFHIHCGLCCGPLESEIFAAPVHVHMQRLYHSVGGESLVEISELVDIAKAGEICISQTCLDYLGTHATHETVEGPYGSSYNLLTGLNSDSPISESLEMFIEQSMSDRLMRRNKKIEEEFIHPAVIRLLSHGGLSPTQIAQMRNICVLFIAMTSNGSSVNWLMEVQAILDKNRCPIVQIIDDDKGVHLVAAVNLYEAIPETSLKGVEVCCELVDKQVGCAIGVAQGATFCGVTGCSTVACRWDITGPPAVRAARLMQFVLKSRDVEVAVDQSVYDDPMAGTRLTLWKPGVQLKGSDAAVPVYTISTTKRYAALRILETVHGRCHDGVVEGITTHINEGRKRCAVLVTGIPLAGKKIVCQRAAGYADLVPYLHLSDDSDGFLQLARTIATWFQYIEIDDVQYLANNVLEHLKCSRWTRAHDECIELVDLSLSYGLRSCFLIDRIQFLDDFSLSLVRECLHGRSKLRRNSSRFSEHSSSDFDLSDRTASEAMEEDGPGKFCFLCVHVSLYNWKSAAQIVADITRSHRSLHIPIITLGEASREELRTLFQDLSDMDMEERWLDAYAEATGYCAGYFIERAAGIRKLSSMEWMEGQKGFTEITPFLKICIPPGRVRMTKMITVRRVSAEVAMRFSQVFDGLPPLFQTFAKILSVTSRTGFFDLQRTVMWEVLNDLVTDGCEIGIFGIVLDELQAMHLIKITYEGDEAALKFRSPALADVAFEVCTPVQIESIGHALIDRLEPLLGDNFKIPLAVATLYHLLGEDEATQKQLWVDGYEDFLQESIDWGRTAKEKWKEAIDDAIQSAGFDSTEILGRDFQVSCPEQLVVCDCIPRLKMYWPPLALGPMAHTFSVICRNTFHEYAAFHGYPPGRVEALRQARTSASKRYLLELDVIESFLAEHGIVADATLIQKERDMIAEIQTPPVIDADVQEKAQKILSKFIPQFIEPRLKRLYALVSKLRDGEIPGVVQRGNEAILHAYKVLRAAKSRSGASQDALMVLATRNWKPKPVPEHLPLLYYQTVARIRNKVLKRLTEGEVFLFKHQQSGVDLEAFLITTPLFQEAQEQGRC